ncbi:MAG TPA: BLUF domain-containing protein [Pseudomonadales bacterium]|nr:BLUF domain-containing protein [Pseudomonadales bacterium]
MREIALCYFSRLAEDIGQVEIREIVAKASRKNAIAGITGCLVVDGGFFAQVLEGPDDVVRAIVDRIAQDSRHHDMRIVWLDTISERAFQTWAMSGIDLAHAPDPHASSIRGLREDLHQFLEMTPDGSQRQFPEFFQHCLACLRDKILPEEIVIEAPSYLRAG